MEYMEQQMQQRIEGGIVAQRNLVRDFWELRISERRDIIEKLGVLMGDDWKLAEPPRYKLAFERILEAGTLGRLINLIDAAKL